MLDRVCGAEGVGPGGWLCARALGAVVMEAAVKRQAGAGLAAAVVVRWRTPTEPATPWWQWPRRAGPGVLGDGHPVQAGAVVSGRIAGVTSASVPSLRELWPYAETPVRRTRQVVGDVSVLLWCVVWWRAADGVRDRVLGLQGAGQRAESAGTGISERLRAAGNAVDGVPFLGSKLASPLRSAAAAGNDLADAGRSAQSAVASTASVLHATMLVVLVGLVLGWWLLQRARWTTAAWAARRLRSSREGLQVLGLRAAATAPLGAVAGALHPRDAEGGVDQHTLEVLGALELDRLGVGRPPTS